MGFLDSDSESDDDSSLGSSSNNANHERKKRQVVAVTATNGQPTVMDAKASKPKPGWDDDSDSDDDSDDSGNGLIKLATSKKTTISPKAVVEELAAAAAAPVVVAPQQVEEEEYEEEMEDNEHDDDVPPPPERLYRETSTDWTEAIAKVKRHTSRIKRGAEIVRFVDPIVTEKLEYSQQEHSVLSVKDEYHIAEEHDDIPWHEQDYQELPWYEQPDLEEDDALTALCKRVLLAGDDAEENKKHLEEYAQRVEAKVIGFALKLKHKTLLRLNSMSSQGSTGNSSHGGGSCSGSGGSTMDKNDMLLHQSSNSFTKHNDSDIRGATERFRAAQQQEAVAETPTESTIVLKDDSLPVEYIIAVETPPNVENGEYSKNGILAQEAKEKRADQEEEMEQELAEKQQLEEEKVALEQQKLEYEAKREKEEQQLAEKKRLQKMNAALEQQRLEEEAKRDKEGRQLTETQRLEEEKATLGQQRLEEAIELAASGRQQNEKTEANAVEHQSTAEEKEEELLVRPGTIEDDWNIVDLASDFILDLTDPLPEKQKELAARSKLEKENGDPARTMCSSGGNVATCLESFSKESRPESFQLELPTQTSESISGRMRQVAEILTRNSSLKTVSVLVPLKSCDDSTRHSDVSKMFEAIGSLKNLEDLSITSQNETIRSGIPTNVITCALRRIAEREHKLVSLTIANLTLTESQAGFTDFAEALTLISGIAKLKSVQVEVEFGTF